MLVFCADCMQIVQGHYWTSFKNDKVDGCIAIFNYTPSTAVLVHFDGNFFIRKCANTAISSCKQVVHLSTKIL